MDQLFTHRITHHQMYVSLTLDAQELWAPERQLKLSADMLIFTICILYVYYMCTTCILYVYYMYIMYMLYLYMYTINILHFIYSHTIQIYFRQVVRQIDRQMGRQIDRQVEREIYIIPMVLIQKFPKVIVTPLMPNPSRNDGQACPAIVFSHIVFDTCDILQWKYKNNPVKYFDVVGAPPSCTEYRIWKQTGAMKIELLHRKPPKQGF